VDITEIVTASLSDVGRMRSENQDACGEFRSAAGEQLLIVADGMGGHRGGATASRICVEAVGREFSSGAGTPEERLRRGLELANAQVRSAALDDPELEGMGTTAVALHFNPDGAAWVAWVGDSRAYRFRHGALEALTEDHSLVAEWVRTGAMTPEEAEVSPRRNELLAAIGAKDEVLADIRAVEVLSADRFLLCSDGLCGVVPEVEIGAVLGFREAETAARELVDKANGYGGPDNVTVQVVCIPGDATAADTAPRRVPGPSELPVREPARGHSRAVPLLAGLIVVGIALAGVAYYALTHGGGGFPLRAGTEVPEESGQRASAKTEELAETGDEEDMAEPAPVEASARPDVRRREVPPSPHPSETRRAQAAPPGVAPVGTGEPLRALGASSTPPPESAPEAGEERIRLFLEDWSRCVSELDYERYRALGLRLSPEDFTESYGRPGGVELSFELLDYQEPEPGHLRLRIRQLYSYRDSAGSYRSEKERRIVVRETGSGLRYAGTWD
jgi:protein phosphatase